MTQGDTLRRRRAWFWILLGVYAIWIAALWLMYVKTR